MMHITPAVVTRPRRAWKLLASLTAAAVLTACAGPEAAPKPIEEELDLSSDLAAASYIIGYQQASNLKSQGNGMIDLATYQAGIADALSDAEAQVPEDREAFVMEALRQAMTTAKTASGEAYREENAAREGVVTLPSGLQYEILVEGSGAKPSATDTVVTHYHGTLTDGTVFDSSVERDSPASFPVNRVIAGWTEALQLMPVGSKWRLVIPPELAYGERGAGNTIPPHATLVFEVELLEIQAAE